MVVYVCFAFYCVNNSAYDFTGFESNPVTNDDGDPSTYASRDNYAATSSGLEHPCASLKKLVSTGTFYFTPYPQWDLSSRVSESMRQKTQPDMASFNGQMLWNEYLVSSLLDFREQLDQEERLEFDRHQYIVRVYLFRLVI